MCQGTVVKPDLPVPMPGKVSDPRLAPNEVILEDWVYDLEKFAAVHPGGATAVKLFGGSNATAHYYMLHQHKEIRLKLLAPFRLRPAGAPVGPSAREGDPAFILNSPAYQDLKTRVRKAIPNQFATAEWYVKAVGIMALVCYLEYSSLAHGFNLLKSTVLGVLMAMIGLCIQHDANHGAVSASGWVNRFWGYTQDWIGGSALLWQHHHVLMHHADTNVEGDDPDITGDLVRFHTLTDWSPKHRFQAMYTWFLLPLLPLKWHFAEAFDLLKMEHMGRPISPMAQGEANIALAFRVSFLLRFYALPMYLYPSLHTAICIVACFASAGLYLGVNFIISHNFEGVRWVLSDADRARHTKRDWAFEQVETSSTVGGRVLGFFHGGLNYQIEHHLFPRISHVHYHKLKPVIEQWCKEQGLRYSYYSSLPANIASTWRHLNALGKDVHAKAA